MAAQFLPVLLTLGVALLTAAAVLGLAALLGQRSRQGTLTTRTTYESGVPLLDTAQKRISVKFYIVALVFVVLDVEVAFLYPWAVAFNQLGLLAFVEALIFIAILVIALVYAWRKGALEWS